MPAMPRIKGTPIKIAFAVLGKPANYVIKKSALQKKIDRELLYQDTQRVR